MDFSATYNTALFFVWLGRYLHTLVKYKSTSWVDTIHLRVFQWSSFSIFSLLHSFISITFDSGCRGLLLFQLIPTNKSKQQVAALPANTLPSVGASIVLRKEDLVTDSLEKVLNWLIAAFFSDALICLESIYFEHTVYFKILVCRLITLYSIDGKFFLYIIYKHSHGFVWIKSSMLKSIK